MDYGTQEISHFNLTGNKTRNTTVKPAHGLDNTSHMPCQKPWSFMPEDVLPNLWLVVYWSSQILSW
jgi:hypothetical protein